MEELKPFLSGVVDDKPDMRNYLYEERVGAGEPFDWNKGYDVEEEAEVNLKVETQNGSLSCVGQGWSKYAEVLNFFDEGIMRNFSAKDIYSHIRLPGGCAMVGDGAKWMVEHGVEEEANVPSYMNGYPPTEAFMAETVARNEERARRFRALSYLTTTHNDIDFLAMMLRDNHGLVSSYIGSNSGWTARILTRPTSEDFGHCVYFGKAKIINGKKYVGFLNSGGEKIGEKGWQWMGEDYFGFLKNIWTLRDLINNEKTMIVDEAKLNQIYNELLLRDLKPEEALTNGYLGKDEDFVRAEVGKSSERQLVINAINAGRSLNR
ncbi:MAG: hypothetical protein WCQ96_02880 [Patescibacteria group bacterium]